MCNTFGTGCSYGKIHILRFLKALETKRLSRKLKKLDHEGRKQELARIIGGTEMTKASLDYAEEMLRAGENI